MQLLPTEKSFKNDEKRFLFYLKNSFRFQGIKVFVLIWRHSLVNKQF